MRTILSVAALLLFVTFSADAQYLFQDAKNPDMMRSVNYNTAPLRNEIVIPQVNGYNVLKADLHVHTMFSDANATPEWRVVEAWCDGLDILAITEHIEYRPTEPKMLEFLKEYAKKNAEAVNYNIVYQGKGNDGIMADLTLTVLNMWSGEKSHPQVLVQF